MASAIFIFNQRGEEMIARHYRADIPKSSVDAFRSRIIGAKATGQNPPVLMIERTSFMFVRHANIFIVGATRANVNASLVFEYLFQKLRIIKSYLGPKFKDEDVHSNFTLIYELFDETMDYGYPQNCAIESLKLYINLGSLIPILDAPKTTGAQLTAQITGAIDWRREGLRYRNNEVYIDIHETVTLIISQTDQILRSEINGRVMMKTALSGMPECKFGLNDKLIMEKEGEGGGGAGGKRGVDIDDCKFHKCVRLNKFESERTITFTPPDGEFDLMTYRVTSPSKPFNVRTTITEEGKTKLIVDVTLTADFPEEYKAKYVTVSIPMPPTAATARSNVCTRGKATYKPAVRALVWKITNMQGMQAAELRAEVDLLPAMREKAWVKPPISVDFQIPMFPSSGVQVRFLKVYEKSSYETTKWVRYLSKAGDYQYRIS
jgi:AP-2 complex subunit mu-1